MSLAASPAASLAAMLADALAHLRAGRFDAAAALCHALLASDPRHVLALRLLGMVRHVEGRFAEAADLFGRALAIGDAPDLRTGRAQALARLGRHEEAILECQAALAADPGHAAALDALGASLDARLRLDEAATAYRRLVALCPDDVAAWTRLGRCLHALGRIEAAAEAFTTALDRDPEGRGPARGETLRMLGRFAEAEAAHRQALAGAPDDPAALHGLGLVLADTGRLDEAEAVLRRVVGLLPGETRPLHSLAIALNDLGRPSEALATLDAAAAHDPADAEIRFLRALVLLGQGRMAEGWADYESRFSIRQASRDRNTHDESLRWHGEPMAGRTLLLTAEQGFGDAIQFARFAPLAAKRGARVILEAQAPLRRLMASLGVIEAVTAPGDPATAFGRHCPLVSLPLALGLGDDVAPTAFPYLAPPGANAQVWRERLAAAGPGLRVGIAWAGNPAHVNDRRRSLPFAALAPLWAVAGVRWFALQVGPRARDIEAAPPGAILDLSPHIGDFADTAAILSALDLVIAPDTALIHLAGALGARAWAMLPYRADWRWGEAGDTTPWYPTLRLFRQGLRHDWSGTVGTLADALGAEARR